MSESNQNQDPEQLLDMTALLSQQDEIMAELENLDLKIMETIESIAAQRKAEDGELNQGGELNQATVKLANPVILDTDSQSGEEESVEERQAIVAVEQAEPLDQHGSADHSQRRAA